MAADPDGVVHHATTSVKTFTEGGSFARDDHRYGVIRKLTEAQLLYNNVITLTPEYSLGYVNVARNSTLTTLIPTPVIPRSCS